MKILKSAQPHGFTLIEVLISMGLVSILSLVVFSLNSFMNQGKMGANNAFQADQFRKEITAHLLNPTAWRNTLRGNATFACVVNSTDCANARTNGPPANDFSFSIMTNTMSPGTACVAGTASCHGGFDVYDINNAVRYAFASDTKRGFQLNGAQCGTNFANGVATAGAAGFTGVRQGKMVVGTSTPNGSLCPFRLVLWWVPICSNTTGACISPSINVKGYMLYAPNPNDPQGKGAISPAAYGINLILPPKF